MKTKHVMTMVLCAGLMGACASVAPKELVNAREANRQAKMGPAAQVAQAELHVANLALAEAEKSFNADPKSYRTRDLSYVAQRRAEIAGVTASITLEQRSQAQSKDEFQATQGRIVERTKEDLDRTRTALTESERSGEVTADKLAVEKKARADADKRAADAQAALAKLAMVKEEPRGMVITLSGSVLFASDQSTLLPAARERLDQVCAVLMTTPDRSLTIEGHTDSQGAVQYNLDLSQRRADAVRNYLVERGYPAAQIHANGLGKGRPVSDNGSAEGRANNRRVEIIIQRETQTSN
jgi:outer membrane protein OmpA-like peptidoglycan-associated protein